MKTILSTYTVYFFVSVFCFVSCTKEFDALPGNQITQDALFTSEDGFKAAVNGLYTSLQNQHYYGGTMISIPELYTPYAKAGGYDDPTLSKIYDAAIGADAIKLEATNPRIRNIWVAIYNTIRACNVFLAKGANGKPSVITNQAVWNNLTGQALAIRALAHFDLLRLFGEHWNQTSIYGIPVMKEVPTVDSKPARNTVKETYDAILQDLDTTLLQGTNQTNPILATGTGHNYIDSNVVKALRARVYLYKGDLEAAKAMAQNVITNSGISLTQNLSQYYSSRNGLDESIFELSFSSQNSSFLNLTTYKNATALINDLVVGADVSALKTTYLSKTGDIEGSQRYNMFDHNNGDRTQKYASLPAIKNNPAYIIRLSEMYLILAEANNKDLRQLANLRTARGVAGGDVSTLNDANGMFAEIIAELNFEGAHVMCARARLNLDDYQNNGKGIFPIPQAERIANSKITQNPKY